MTVTNLWNCAEGREDYKSSWISVSLRMILSIGGCRNNWIIELMFEDPEFGAGSGVYQTANVANSKTIAGARQEFDTFIAGGLEAVVKALKDHAANEDTRAAEKYEAAMRIGRNSCRVTELAERLDQDQA